MTDNRSTFDRGTRDGDFARDQRWRRAEERYRAEARGDSDHERNTAGRHTSGYSNAYPDDFGEYWQAYGGYRQERHRDDGGWQDRQRQYGGHRDRGDHTEYRGGQYRDSQYRDSQYRSPARSGVSYESRYRSGPGAPASYDSGYEGSGDSRYFTGGQGSWAIDNSPYRNDRYNSPATAFTGHSPARFGEDYREHGYEDHRHSDDNRRSFLDRAGDEIASWFGDQDAARRREQDHRGRGPRDYVRSDERIREDANDRLTEDWRIDASDIAVSVKDGEITLNGTVDDRQAKRRAEDLVESISGARHVQNNLRISQAARSAHGSAGIGIGYETSRTPEQVANAEGGTLASRSQAKARVAQPAAGQMTQGESGMGESGMGESGMGGSSTGQGSTGKAPGSN